MSTQIEQDAPPAKAAREELHQGIIPLDEEGTVCFQSSSAELLTQALGFSLHVEDDFFEATVEDAKMRQRELQQKLLATGDY
ncbi:unnamed protein product [Cyprideis torosa]|uniref:Uncharacterized protein n=1 Tax=Cyprideis torosa TaxID=163714 RepID=A0A7R8W842_9CRUS|nr:unnamed protein product [Cyprideis torosa]CAG0888214.1 unnamed protein product [Cyprideis torosa]